MSDTVIALREDCILTAEGKSGRRPKITKASRIEVEGYAEPLEQWKQALLKYKESSRPGKVKLILPTTYSSTRMTQIPYATGRELSKMAANIMQESAAGGISDYGVTQMDKKQGVSLCCASAETETIEDILNVCKEIGLNVDDITVPMEGYLKGLSKVKNYVKKTSIFLLFEDSGVTSILFQDGVYLYSTRSRIFSERGTLDFGTEIVRNISGILQFYSTRKATSPITDVFYAGCAKDDFEVCVPGIYNMNLAVEPLATDFTFESDGDPEEWLVCIGAMMDDGKKQVNLYRAWQEQSESGNEITKGNIGKHLIAPGIALGVCIVLIAGVNVWNMFTNSQVKKLEAWIQDDTVQKEYKAAKKTLKKSERLDKAKNQVDQMKANLATYPDLNAEMIATIVDSSGSDVKVEIESMDAETGFLTFHAVSGAVIDIPGYVSRLTDTGLFSDVDYSGYQFQDGEYSLELSCVLKEAETGGEK